MEGAGRRVADRTPFASVRKDVDEVSVGREYAEPLRVSIGGLGAIGLRVARALDAGIPGLSLVAVSARDHGRALARLGDFQNAPPVKPLDRLGDDSDVVVECAPAAVFRQIAEPALRFGRVLMPLSIGQLLFNPDLVDLAARSGARILVPSGAMLGLDALRAASEGEIHMVRLVTKNRRARWLEPYILKGSASTWKLLRRRYWSLRETRTTRQRRSPPISTSGLLSVWRVWGRNGR